MTASPGTGAKIGVALAALGPPALVGALWPTVRAHPVWSVLALLAYWTLLAVIGVAKRVVREVAEQGIQRFTQAVHTRVWRYRAKYLTRLEEHVRHVDLLGATTPTEFAMKLSDVYIDVSLKHRSPAGAGDTPVRERRPLSTFLDDPEHPVYVITGGPGSGKTTLLRRTALELAHRRSRGGRMPVYLELRRHVAAITGDPRTTLASLATSLGWLDGEKDPEAWFERNLERGRFLVMLDGLDEVADESDRRRTVDWVRRQITRHPANAYLLTSRPHGYATDRLANADELEIRRFTAEQIGDFVRNWYHATLARRAGEDGPQVAREAELRSDGLIEGLRGKPALYHLAENPLLLTMITNVHLSGNVLPGSRAALYQEICAMLLHRRQEAKSLPTELRVEQKLAVCRTLAAHMMNERIRDIPVDQARRVIAPVLAAAAPGASTEDFLVDAQHSGMLIEPAIGVYAFAHLTFQEYLTAAEIKEHRSIDVLTSHVDEPWWQETTLLWAAGSDATPVVEACIASGGVHALKLAFACRHEAGMITPEVRRRLDAMTAESADLDDGQRRALTAARVALFLNEVAWLSRDLVVCTKPVSGELYGLYLRDRGLVRRDGSRGTGDDPAVGMWDGDAVEFVRWVNGLPGVEHAYRLPTREEIDQATRSAEVAGLDGHRCWCAAVPSPVPYPEPDWASSPRSLRHSSAASILTGAEMHRRRVTPLTTSVRELLVIPVLEDTVEAARDLATSLERRTTVTETSATPDFGPLITLLERAQGVTVIEGLAEALDGIRDVSVRLRDARRRLDTEKALATGRERTHRLVRRIEAALAEQSSRPQGLDEEVAHITGADLDRAVARMNREALTRGTEPDAELITGAILLLIWNNRHRRPREKWAQFNTVLKETAADRSGTEIGALGRLAPTIDEVVDRLELAHRSPDDPGAWRLFESVRLLAGHIRTLVAPVLDGRAPARSDTLALARLEVAVIEESTSDDELRAMLRSVNYGLADIEQRATGAVRPDEVLLLVRS